MLAGKMDYKVRYGLQNVTELQSVMVQEVCKSLFSKIVQTNFKKYLH